LTVALAVSPQIAFAGPETDAGLQFIKAIDGMMIELGTRSARASAAIKDVYRGHLDLLVLEQYAALEGALGTGGLVSLPPDPLRFNLKPRVDGSAPIGEKDLDNQASYLAARPAALGALFDVASRVTSGPVEVTSLVRHSKYQDALRQTNSNARTSVPTHTMGLAFDIALINTPLETVYEIRDVLRQMQAAGDILVIGERKQLVFHVVPHPSRLGHFTDVYNRAIAADMPGANVIPAAPVGNTVTTALRPTVTADIVSVRPTEDFAQEWWASDGAQSDLLIEVAPRVTALPEPAGDRPLLIQLAARCATAIGGLLSAVRGILT
jgi:hypothetical protein